MVLKKKGKELFDLLVELTGVEEDVLRGELVGIIDRLNLDAEHLTTEDLRRVVAQYLEDVQGAVCAGTERPLALPMAQA